jgi:biopolymer transport protein ExbB
MRTSFRLPVRGRVIAMPALALSFAVGAVAAAAPAPEAAEAIAPALPSVWELATKGGVMMVPIAILSLVMLAVIAERLLVLRRPRVIPPGFVAELRPRLPPTGGSPAPAIAWCREQSSPIARVVAAGLRRLGGPLETLERHIAEAGEREAIALRRRLRVLSVIAAVAPLMGLLGTILGMIDAFRTVASAGDALGRTELLAEGIYEAMITTAAGLMVAIPALISYHWLSARVQNLVAGLDAEVVELIEDLAPAAHAIPAAPRPSPAPAAVSPPATNAGPAAGAAVPAGAGA